MGSGPEWRLTWRDTWTCLHRVGEATHLLAYAPIDRLIDCVILLRGFFLDLGAFLGGVKHSWKFAICRGGCVCSYLKSLLFSQ